MVELCIRRAWVVILAAGLLGCGCAVYAARHFAISTDVRKLLSPDLPWRQRELAYQAAFRNRTNPFSPWSKGRPRSSPALPPRRSIRGSPGRARPRPPTRRTSRR
jgi:hypothetical protein